VIVHLDAAVGEGRGVVDDQVSDLRQAALQKEAVEYAQTEASELDLEGGNVESAEVIEILPRVNWIPNDPVE